MILISLEDAITAMEKLYEDDLEAYGCDIPECFNSDRAIDALKKLKPALPGIHGRLVDIDELSKKMYHDAFESDTDLQKWDSGCWIRYKMFENNRDAAPTVIEAEG